MFGHLKIYKKNLKKSPSFVVICSDSMAPKTAFSPDQITWIIYKYGEMKSIGSVIRAYRVKVLPTNPRDMPSRGAFKKIMDRFESSGGNAKQKERSGKDIRKCLNVIHLMKMQVYYNLIFS